VLFISTFAHGVPVPRWNGGPKGSIVGQPWREALSLLPQRPEAMQGWLRCCGKIAFCKKFRCCSRETPLQERFDWLSYKWSVVRRRSWWGFESRWFHTSALPVQMPGYWSWMLAQNSQRAGAQVLGASYETSTDGCKVVFKALLGMWELAPKLFWNAVRQKDVMYNRLLSAVTS